MSEDPGREALDAYSAVVTRVAAQVLPSVASLTVRTARGVAGGSASVISGGGVLLTSAHVVAGAAGAEAAFADGTLVGAAVVGRDPLSDLAVLRADGPVPAPVPHGWATVLELSGMADHGAGAPADAADPAEPTDPAATPGEQSAEDLFAELEQSMQGMHDGADVDLFDTVATRVPEGRLVTSALLSILLTDDGRVLVDAVPGDTLRELA